MEEKNISVFFADRCNNLHICAQTFFAAALHSRRSVYAG